MVPQKWRRWLEKAVARTRARRSLPRWTKPGLESLEDRMLPSTTIVVSDLNDDGSANSLRAAVQRADATGGAFTIKLLSGKTYHLNNGAAVIGDLAVRSTGAAAVNLTVTTTAAGLAAIEANLTSRLFEVFGDTGHGGAALTLVNVHLNRGKAAGTGGGGVLVGAGGTLHLKQSEITNCVDQGQQGSAAQGGAIFNSGTTTIENSQILSNQALGFSSAGSATYGGDAYAGGIFDNGSLQISNSTLSGNTALGGASSGCNPTGGAGFGGAIAVTDLPEQGSPSLQVTGSTFAGNVAGGGAAILAAKHGSAQGGVAEGGALFWAAGGEGLFINNTFAFNTAQGGGASVTSIQHGPHSAKVHDDDDNKSDEADDDHGDNDHGDDDHGDDDPGDKDGGDKDGGDNDDGDKDGGDNDEHPVHSPAGSLAYGGDAEGGAIFDSGSGGVELGFDTIAYNHAFAGTGPSESGDARGGGIVRAGNSQNPLLFMENDLVARNSATSASPNVMGGFSSTGHNLIGDVSGGTGFSTAKGDILGGGEGAPVNPGLDTQLRSNGGPTQTLALVTGSVAIDHGDNSFEAPDSGVDQRGSKRPQPIGGRVDIGAYELIRARISVSESYSVHWNPTAADNNSISGNLLTPLLSALLLSTSNGSMTVTASNPPPGFSFHADGTFTYKPPLGFFAVVPPLSFHFGVSVNGQDLGVRLNVFITVYRGLRTSQQV